LGPFLRPPRVAPAGVVGDPGSGDGGNRLQRLPRHVRCCSGLVRAHPQEE
jgi:hypothetical protein